jgi:D-alanyl-D-alanine carboxypeptidase
MVSASGLLSSIEKLVEDAYHPDEPGAVVFLSQNEQVLYRDAIGLANLEHRVAISPGMPFRLASLTKPITACALLMLEQAGQLQLSDPITRFLPDYPQGDSSITLEHLLTHTSGIQNYTQIPGWWDIHRQDLALSDLIDLFRSHPPVSAPGARWAYNNSGYVLLGAVIEQVSGQPYGDFIEQHIFGPLGMQDSYYGGKPERIYPGLVSGYSKPGDEYVRAEYISYTQLSAAGGLISSVDDLSKWFSALCSGRLVERERLERGWKPYQLSDGESVPYGYGWMLSSYQGHRMVEHYGWLFGYVHHLIGLPDDGILSIVLSNNDSHLQQPEKLAFEMAAQALGQPYQAPRSIAMSSEQLSAYTGQYTSRYGETLSVVLEDQNLYLLIPDPQKLEIRPISAQEFFLPALPQARVTFTLASEGQIDGLTWQPRQKVPVRARKTF